MWSHKSYNQLSVISDYNYILAMLLGSSKNGRLVVNWRWPDSQFSTTSGTTSVIRRDAVQKTFELTAPGGLNTWIKGEGQRWIVNGPTILLWYMMPLSLGFDTAMIEPKACWKLFVNMTQLGLDMPTSWLTVQASTNCAIVTPCHTSNSL